MSKSDERPIWFFGCDMGGWHNKKRNAGDALGVCKLADGDLIHVEETADINFYPVAESEKLNDCVEKAIKEEARIIVGIDAALAWPIKFRDLVQNAPSGDHDFDFTLDGAINNPYLYRETERFIKKFVLTGANECPLTAVGDKFGNNSSKAQALVKWFQNKLAPLYRPPFDDWDRNRAAKEQFTVLEVYPAASMKSEQFKKLKWPTSKQDMGTVGNTDIADAKRCAMTAFCYAVEIGMTQSKPTTPSVWTPDDAKPPLNITSIPNEGWIFAPKK